MKTSLYKFFLFLGDVSAVSRGPKAITKRAIRKVAYGGIFSGLLRWLK